jgi:hypothetical protein
MPRIRGGDLLPEAGGGAVERWGLGPTGTTVALAAFSEASASVANVVGFDSAARGGDSRCFTGDAIDAGAVAGAKTLFDAIGIGSEAAKGVRTTNIQPPMSPTASAMIAAKIRRYMRSPFL